MKRAVRLGAHVLLLGAGWWAGVVWPAHGGRFSTPPPGLPSEQQSTSPAQAASAGGQVQGGTPATVSSVKSASALETLQTSLKGLENWADLYGLGAKLKTSELPQALTAVLAHRNPRNRSRLVRELFRVWAERDRQGALVAAVTIESPQMRQKAVTSVLDTWVKTDADAAWAWVVGLEDDSVLQESVIGYLLATTAASDPKRYAVWADKLEDSLLRGKALEEVANAWLEKDPAGALAWLPQGEPASLRLPVLEAMRWKDKVPAADALTIISKWPDRAVRIDWTADVLSRYAQESPVEAARWLAAQGANSELQKAAGTLGGVLAENKTSVAEIKSIAARLGSDLLREVFVSEAVFRCATSDRLEDALLLLPMAGPGMERETALWAIASKFAEKSASRGEVWLRSLPPGDDRDSAIGSFSGELVKTQPQSALEWGVQIGDPQVRRENMEELFQAWRKADAGRANAWLWATTRLTAEEKKSFNAIKP